MDDKAGFGYHYFRTAPYASECARIETRSLRSLILIVGMFLSIKDKNDINDENFGQFCLHLVYRNRKTILICFMKKFCLNNKYLPFVAGDESAANCEVSQLFLSAQLSYPHD